MALWQRSQQRADARTRTGLAAAACSLLTDHFQHQGGHQSATSPSHGMPHALQLLGLAGACITWAGQDSVTLGSQTS